MMCHSECQGTGRRVEAKQLSKGMHIFQSQFSQSAVAAIVVVISRLSPVLLFIQTPQTTKIAKTTKISSSTKKHKTKTEKLTHEHQCQTPNKTNESYHSSWLTVELTSRAVEREAKNETVVENRRVEFWVNETGLCKQVTVACDETSSSIREKSNQRTTTNCLPFGSRLSPPTKTQTKSTRLLLSPYDVRQRLQCQQLNSLTHRWSSNWPLTTEQRDPIVVDIWRCTKANTKEIHCLKKWKVHANNRHSSFSFFYQWFRQLEILHWVGGGTWPTDDTTLHAIDIADSCMSRWTHNSIPLQYYVLHEICF